MESTPRLYRIKSTGKGQSVYGNCERCGKPCNLHYMRQSATRLPTWITSQFGHIECLNHGAWTNAPIVD